MLLLRLWPVYPAPQHPVLQPRSADRSHGVESGFESKQAGSTPAPSPRREVISLLVKEMHSSSLVPFKYDLILPHKWNSVLHQQGLDPEPVHQGGRNWGGVQNESLCRAPAIMILVRTAVAGTPGYLAPILSSRESASPDASIGPHVTSVRLPTLRGWTHTLREAEPLAWGCTANKQQRQD